MGTKHILPQVFAGRGPYKVIPSPKGTKNAYTIFEQNTICVPNDDSQEALALRAHEYGHLLMYKENLLPADIHAKALKAGIPEELIQRLMDHCVNTVMIRRNVQDVAHLPLQPAPTDEKEIAALPIDSRATMHIAERAIGDRGWGVTLPESVTYRIDQMLYELAGRRCLGPRKGKRWLDLAKQIAEFLGMLSDAEKKAGEPAEDMPAPGVTDDRPETEIALDPGKLIDFINHGRDTTGKWGTMEIACMPLTRSCRPRGRKFRPSFVGGMRYPHRLAIPASDGRAWASKQRYRGATVLIDVSGSMHVTSDQIDTILAYSPAATVAVYAGSATTNKGQLLILAKDGMKGELPTKGRILDLGGNVVDGPALEWLINQGGPRVWVCDGLVTGEGDKQYKNLNTQAFGLCRKGRIFRVESIAGYIAGLEKQYGPVEGLTHA